jgi:predicted O-methyltransferase YrrM
MVIPSLPTRGVGGCLSLLFAAIPLLESPCLCLVPPSAMHNLGVVAATYARTRTRTTMTMEMTSDPSTTITTSSTSIKTKWGSIVAYCPELGGDVVRIRAGPDVDDEDDDDGGGGFLASVGVPTFAVVERAPSSSSSSSSLTLAQTSSSLRSTTRANGEQSPPTPPPPRRMGLEGILRNPNAFVLDGAISVDACERILNACEYDLGFGSYDVGKNNHGAMQVVVSRAISDELFGIIGPHVDVMGVARADDELSGDDRNDVDYDYDGGGGWRSSSSRRYYAPRGINRRFRIYRYAPDGNERFAPHVDAGFPPGGSSLDDDDGPESASSVPFLHWDASHQYPSSSSSSSSGSNVVSRLTVLIYLNDDFRGGHTRFYEPASERRRGDGIENDSICDDCDGGEEGVVVASVRPRAGSILVFPQAVTESAVERARRIWPLHEGSPVISGKRPKYVIRTDVLFETIMSNDFEIPEGEEVLFQHDDAVRDVFLNVSPMFSTRFLHHVWPLFNPHMGVENAGPLLYSFVRFTKVRNVVEVGAGYTTLYLLQALKDNEEEMHRVSKLDEEGRLRLLDYPFGTPSLEEWAHSLSPACGNPTSPPSSFSSSLLCIDNCEHQRETASSAVGVARTLGLDSYLQFLKGDAFDALDRHFSSRGVETVDMLWCDFGVGSRMTEFVSRVWRFLRPGGFLVCHSTLTNEKTRMWLEGVRRRAGAEKTGIPAEEYAELSLLEPHKRFQNSVTILQKRVSYGGTRFEEPIYSEYA